MTYRRRYLSGQSATTVVIAEGAITTDKIVDKAVTQPKVADDAVTSDKIAPGAVESSDIKDGEVKTADIAAGAVVTSKIADGAVTTQKLEASIQGIARPLTPGVSSAEIAAGAVVASKIGAEAVETAKIKDGNVNAAKLAADSVETVKIKDDAVSTAKIAGGAVTETKIGVNAVTGSKIAAGVVSAAELAANAVETAKVKDANITLDKMAADSVGPSQLVANAVTETRIATDALGTRHLETFHVNRATVFDDFVGPPGSGPWILSGESGFSWAESNHGRVLQTKPTIASTARITRRTAPDIMTIMERLPTLDVGVGFGTDPTFSEHIIGFYFDANNYIAFYSEELAGGAATWKAKCIKGGVASVIDTGIDISPAADNVRILKIDVAAPNSVKFFVDGIEKAEITDTQFIPDTTYDLRLQVTAKENANKSLRLRYLLQFEDRWPHGG